jgi:hypothetical protein
MNGRRLFLLPVIVLALGCSDDRQLMGPRTPTDPSEIISDGAHGGNKDFFFLPPMVPLPLNNPDFELGEFNNALQPSLKIEICELTAENLNAAGRPSETTPCVAGAPLKTFPAGSVKLVNLPKKQWGWWSFFNLPPDGFYYVLWDTRQSNLNVNKYYRIKVLINGSTEPLGVADVDPMSSLKQWQYSKTGEVVQLVDDVWLPIPFRVENHALCEGATQCASTVLTNDNPDGDSQILQVTNEDGVPIAGVQVFDGWLPDDGPQSVVFTIYRVNTGVNNVAAGTQSDPCHANLSLQQFDACFNYSTIPDLGGVQFTATVIAGVCFVLADTEDPREPWVQLWSSEPDDPEDTPKPLRSADASAILTNEEGRNCGTQEVILGSNSSNPLTRLAGLGWHKLTGGVGRMFGVKTAYAVDLGLGGILDDISNIGPALTAKIEALTPTAITVDPGAGAPVRARVVGTKVHNGDPLGAVTAEGNTRGIPGIPVTFALQPGNGTLTPFSGEGEQTPVSQITRHTSSNTTSIHFTGIAGVIWTPPTAAGTYTLTADGQANGGPVTYTATVTAPPDFIISSGTPVLTPSTIPTSGGTITLSAWALTNQGGPLPVISPPMQTGIFLSTDQVLTPDDLLLGNFSTSDAISGETTNRAAQQFSIPARTAGTYYILIVADYSQRVAESNESNNHVSAALTVSAPPPPDLIVSSGSPTLTPSILPSTGGPIQISNYTIRNQGGPVTTEAWIAMGVYLSTDPIITTADWRLDANAVPGINIGAGGVTFVGPTVTLPPRSPGAYYIGILADIENGVVEADESNNYVSSGITVSDFNHFELYSNGSSVCDGAAACPVTNEFASRSVTFSFISNSGAAAAPSLCRTTHGPIGEGSNYGVSPPSTTCSGWQNGSVTMTFSPRPRTVTFQLEGNNLGPDPFPVSAVDAAGNAIPVTAGGAVTYTDHAGNTMRRETRSVTSLNNVATVTVNSGTFILIIDNLTITPVPPVQ